MSDAKNAESLPKKLPTIDSPEGIEEILRRAGRGDSDMLPLVRKLFDQDQGPGRGWADDLGDMYAHACQEMVKSAVGKDLALQEAIGRKIDAVRDELAGPNPTPLERILCERVALTWFDAHETDRRYVDQSKLSFKDAAYRESRRDRAHRRFLAACKTLATVRRLAVPAVQINLAAQQQVNQQVVSGLPV